VVLSRTRLPCLWDDPAHEVELAVVESDQDSKVEHDIALAHICLTGLTKVSDCFREIGLDLTYLRAELLVVQSCSLALVCLSANNQLLKVDVVVFLVSSTSCSTSVAVLSSHQLISIIELIICASWQTAVQ
jgi:hypothetical protein